MSITIARADAEEMGKRTARIGSKLNWLRAGVLGANDGDAAGSLEYVPDGGERKHPCPP